MNLLSKQTQGPDMIKGWFVDWDGITRRTEYPLDGYHCLVEGCTVEVCKQDGEVIFTAFFWPDLELLEAALQEVGQSVVHR